jgi:23S rRNA-/tRNA-specific pseudouridylate synthase
MSVAPSGKPAETEFSRLAAGGGVSVVELRPITGRTHQLRAQLAAVGHPILGDRRYFQAGSRSTAQRLGVRRLCLHAAALEFPHPGEGATVRVEAPLPEIMARIAAKAGFRPGSP